METKILLQEIYSTLLKEFKPQKWWPAKSNDKKARQFEICIGAILTQNTSWKNVEKALENLRKASMLNEQGIRNAENKKLALLIKSSGYYNQKAKKLKAFVEFLKSCPLEKLERIPLKESRDLLLEVHGIGKETADSILLYALNKPIFVIDAYTKRSFSKIMPEKTRNLKEYDEWQEFFSSNLDKDAQLFNEYHALIVNLGKNFCKNKPLCGECPTICCSHKAH
jgi:endonuclease-3 related protein